MIGARGRMVFEFMRRLYRKVLGNFGGALERGTAKLGDQGYQLGAVFLIQSEKVKQHQSVP
jgi:hypothetical protein